MPKGQRACPRGKEIAPGAEGLHQGQRGCPRGCPWGRVVTQMWAPHPKMGWGHNLQHMAPFGALTSGFCMVFDSLTLIFLTPDPIFGAPNPRGRPWEARGPFWAQKGGPKNITLWRDWSTTRFPRIFCEGNGLCGTQEPFGCGHFPPIPPMGGFSRDFPQIRKSSGPPWAPGWVAYWPFVGPWPIAGVGGMAAGPLLGPFGPWGALDPWTLLDPQAPKANFSGV